MKTTIIASYLALLAAISVVNAFVPQSSANVFGRGSALGAKYNSMDEILALFPDDKPVLINFYDAGTENSIKDDILRAKNLLEDRAKLVSIKQQDYPEIAKLWDADSKSPSMILFKDGKPVTRLYEQTHYLEIVAHMGKFCDES
ncbi:predicted protein [Phaeodactylum tricornutum CCAP 1055/1]|jgi:hypothetical protein|uniref:Thioredoxin domain-containing protein n=2 Tax=Phaeodactylum tricornutum TaxID=2850 RepID=B7FPZ1_PHATC|nr:predicted protein [Phaeodactylum tricornutum CCAP 1055/1]EEC51257.1 predicted protein [Phaeodactylum tricornutum CCAP 1055/1]|eukprot:XP_002176794.1 predicted protein [Phaeodactylum tricornutum CCAP 1055/1]